MPITVGTDTYGRVKTVAGTPIVTKFAMLQMVPIYPVQSFYFAGVGPTRWSGIPFIAGSQSSAIHGIPLAAVDRMSVVVAYARGLCAILFLLGFVPLLIGGIMSISGPPPDRFARIAMVVCAIIFFIGAIGGLLTYTLARTPAREHAIRHYCAELLGISADPARVPADISARLDQLADERCRCDATTRNRLLLQLIAVRAKIAQDVEIDRMELKTDELLAHLQHADRVAA